MSDLLRKLNSPEYLPPMAYRRNHAAFELVSYVNCLIGCRISSNADGEALFKERFVKFFADHGSESNTKYASMVREYLELS